MLKPHPFNSEESLRVYRECEYFIKPKECYANVYFMAAYYAHLFQSNEWKVAYGFIRIFPDNNMWARHAFIVNRDGEAIDPTYFSHENRNEGESKESMSFFIFDEVTSHALAVRRNDNIPDLIQPLREYEFEMAKWAQDNNMLLLGGLYTGIEKHIEMLKSLNKY